MEDTIRLIRILKKHKKYNQIDYHQYRTLKGQVLNGDIEGAKKGLKKILSRKKGI